MLTIGFVLSLFLLLFNLISLFLYAIIVIIFFNTGGSFMDFLRYVCENLKNFEAVSSDHVHLKQFLNVAPGCDDENSYSVTTSFSIGYDGIINLALLSNNFYDDLDVWEVFSISNKNTVCYEGYSVGLADTLKINPMSEDELRLTAFAIDDIKSILKLK